MFPLKKVTINWGDGSLNSLNTAKWNSGEQYEVSHTYEKPGGYTAALVVDPAVGASATAYLQLQIAPGGLGSPGVCISAYSQGAAPLSPALFMTRGDGRLWQNYWDQAAAGGVGAWSWTDSGNPGSNVVPVPSPFFIYTSLNAQAGALFTAPLKLMGVRIQRPLR